MKGAVRSRERWASRTAFLLASIGFAVGLGNIWRFPWLSYRYGGGVFLIPYFTALLLIGLPMLMVELGLGRHFQSGDVEAFGKIHRRLRGIGVTSILSAFAVTTYYVNILAWSLVYFVGSFKSPMPWAGESESLEDARSFLFDDVLHYPGDEQLDAAKSYIISGYVYGGLVVVWIVIFFSIAFGIKTVGRVVKLTVPLPIILIIIMLIYNATLDGARDGVEAYIGEWNLSDLGQKSIWPAAVGQIFFTIGISLGVLTAYGSYNSEDSDIVGDHLIIAGSNSLISIIAGFAVYSVIGHVAHNDGKPIDEVANVKGVTLAFVTYPRGMLSFPGAVSNVMSVLFFLTLFTLGIDSAFSLIEGWITVLRDTPRFRHVSRVTMTGYSCAAGFLFSTIFATDLGLAFLDVIDHNINFYGLMMTGLFQSVAVSWVFGWKDTVTRVGTKSASIFTYGYGTAVVVGVGLCGVLYDVMEDSMYFAVAVPVGVAIFAISIAWAFLERRDRSTSFLHWGSQVIFAGPEILRNSINDKSKLHGKMQLPWIWDILVKYVIPPILLGLLLNSAISDATNTDADYYHYPGWLHAIGIAVLVLMLAFIAIFAVFPDFWEKTAGRDSTDDGQNLQSSDPSGLKPWDSSAALLDAPKAQAAIQANKVDAV